MQKFKDFIYYNRKELFIIIVFLSLFGIYIYYDNKDSSDDIVLEDISKDEITEKEENNYLEKEVTIMVDVKGEVNKPGAYTFSLGKRVIDAIKESGGLKENADTKGINLSQKLYDEMVIIIPPKEVIETNLSKEEDTSSSSSTNSSVKQNQSVENNALIKKQSDNKISINTASLSELMSISGIGEKKAQSIIDYRKTNKFKTIEEVKNVSGIGEALFEKIKNYIKV